VIRAALVKRFLVPDLEGLVPFGKILVPQKRVKEKHYFILYVAY
jgi:hypothetical protein